jgi:hypothetical protein
VKREPCLQTMSGNRLATALRRVDRQIPLIVLAGHVLAPSAELGFEEDFAIDDLLEGQYSNPVRIIGFNTTEGWSRDVSEDLAHELRQRCAS